MISGHYGEFAALLVAAFWSITAWSFEKVGKKAGLFWFVGIKYIASSLRNC